MDDIHQRYFLKTELIVFDTYENIQLSFKEVLFLCKGFFEKYLPVSIINTTNETNQCSLNIDESFDIVDTKNSIELGSYGIRSATINDKKVWWMYATGVAVPRLTYAINLNRKIGYHDEIIGKAQIGTFEKILEEIDEMKDAHLSKNKVMELVEISDLYGAIEFYVSKNYPSLSMKEIKKMSQTTKRAFENGRR